MENRLELLTSVDVLNTLHGGISEPQVSLNQLEGARELRIKVPGVDLESIQVEVNNNILSIYYTMNITSAGKNIRLPYGIYNRQVPYYIDISKIHSVVDETELVITLPFNALADGYHRKIKTKVD
jgi:HSP20 family molecular chaperone IbpA